jgi:hypothetical protein
MMEMKVKFPLSQKWEERQVQESLVDNKATGQRDLAEGDSKYVM